MSFKVVHYINQFFANIGGEEMAHVAPELREGFVGPGMAFNQAWKGEAEIVQTIVCGDSYFAEHEKDAKAQVLELSLREVFYGNVELVCCIIEGGCDQGLYHVFVLRGEHYVVDGDGYNFVFTVYCDFHHACSCIACGGDAG